MNEVKTKNLLYTATETVCRQGMIPFPVSDAAIQIINIVVGDRDEELKLICAFKEKSSQTLAQLAESSGFAEEKVEMLAKSLAARGLIFNQPGSSGLKVFRLLPFMVVGLMEYLFMGELKGTQKEKTLAELFESMTLKLRQRTQKDYDQLIPIFEKMPSVDRTVPHLKTQDGQRISIVKIDRKVDVPDEVILPSQSVWDIIDKFDDIAVGYCFCRQRRKVLGKSCETDSPTFNCFTFGKSARYTVEQGFAKKVSKKEARRIMEKAAGAGLVHKAFHPNAKEEKLETSICNCCKDCCDTMNLWRNGTTPLVNSTYHLACVEKDLCTGCGVCEERCPTEAITVTEDGVAGVDEKSCFGCGVCARFCPEKAVLLRQGLRRVFILPPRLRD